MAENQLFPVFDLPEIPDNPEYDERYYPSVYFDFETGDFLRDGAGRMIASAGDIGTEFDDLAEIPDRESRESEIERTITEALLVHPATEYVRDFEFTHEGDETYCSFVVKGYPWEEDKTLSIQL